MKAPSEKHLEDWIVDHPSEVGGIAEEPDYQPIESEFERIVSRQLRLPAGICDLIAYRSGHQVCCAGLTVIELKKNALIIENVIQTLRYMRDLQYIFLNVADLENYDRRPSIHDLEGEDGSEVSGLLIGYGTPNKFIQMACAAAEIRLLSYDYTGETYTFNVTNESPSENYRAYQEFGYGIIGDEIRQIVRTQMNAKRAHS